MRLILLRHLVPRGNPLRLVRDAAEPFFFGKGEHFSLRLVPNADTLKIPITPNSYSRFGQGKAKLSYLEMRLPYRVVSQVAVCVTVIRYDYH